MPTWQTHLLANGLKVVTIPLPHLHVAEVALYLRVGSRHDPAERLGLSHFLEHMLFRGTAEHPSPLALEQAFEALGGAVNAATDAETTCFYSRLHPSRVAEGLALFAAMLQRPRLDDLALEQRIITEEALEDLNEHGAEVNPDTLMARLLWPEHPLGRPTVGTLEGIAAITAADLQAHLERYYRPNNAVLAVAGPSPASQLLEAARASFGDWQAAPLPGDQLLPAEVPGPQSRFVHNSDSQVDLQIAFRGLSLHDPQLPALRLLRRILAGGGSSRLHLSLRERLGIVYAVDATIGAYHETGCLAIDLATAPANLSLAVTEVLAEARRLATEPPPAAELDRVRQSYLFELEFSQDSAYELAHRAGWGELLGVGRSLAEEREELLRVTPATLHRLAAELFAPERLQLVAVGPVGKGLQEKVLEKVAAFAGAQ